MLQHVSLAIHLRTYYRRISDFGSRIWDFGDLKVQRQPASRQIPNPRSAIKVRSF
jgi:hypothetical protein